MTKRSLLLRSLSLFALSALLFGCGGEKKEETSSTTSTEKKSEGTAGGGNYKFVTNGISPFWDAMSKGLDSEKAELKVNADWQAPSPAEHNAQVKIINDAVAAKVDGLAISVIEADALAPTIDKVIAEGVPVITVDSDSPKSKRLAYIGTDNRTAGKMAGEAAVKLFPTGGKLVAFVGNMGAQNARERYEGFQEAVKGKNITFLQAPFEDNKDKGKAVKNVARPSAA